MPISPDTILNAERVYAKDLGVVRAITHHIPYIRWFARGLSGNTGQTPRILELGTGRGASTNAFWVGQPGMVINTYDLLEPARLKYLRSLAGVTFTQWDIKKLALTEDYDAIFIDDEHTYEQVAWELVNFAPKASQFLLLHDTFSERFPGVSQALRDWRDSAEGVKWKLFKEFKHDHGLTILERK